MAPHHLVTHGVILGMTGSGKTGLLIALLEEAVRSRIPVLALDIKGDLPNLFLAFRDLAPAAFEPWLDAAAATRAGRTVSEVAEEAAAGWTAGLARWGLGAGDVAALADAMAPRLLTPGGTFGEPVHVLSPLERPGDLWDVDEEAARDELSAAVSLLLRLVGQRGDPRERAHVVVAHLAERRARSGKSSTLAELLGDLATPPIARLGALPFDEYFPEKERRALVVELNTLLASPKLASWLRGAPLDPGSWLAPRADGKSPVVVASVAHLDGEEREAVLAVLLDAVLAWTRSLSGTSELRALVVLDEAFGFLPPHPANPATKPPLLALLKQARAFGVGVVVATQNPMDLDYKALSNAGAWFVGRLSTDADRERVVEALTDAGAAGGGLSSHDLATTLKQLPPRTFFVRDVHRKEAPCVLVETRWCLSWLRGPMTRREMSALAKQVCEPQASAASAPAPMPGASNPSASVGTPTAVTQDSPRADAPLAPAGPAPTTVLAIPEAPPGYAVYFGFAPAAAAPSIPRIAAQLVVRARDAELGAVFERRHAVVASLDAAGRAPADGIAVIDPRALQGAPRPLPAEELPRGLATKAARAALEKALRDHAMAKLPVVVEVAPELGLVRDDGETQEAFGARCNAEAQRRMIARQHEIAAQYAPRIAKATQRLNDARGAWHGAAQRASGAPSGASTFFLGLVAGKRAAGAAGKERELADTALERARVAGEKADAALREETLAQATEMSTCEGEMQRAARRIEVRRILAKKGEIEVTGLGVVWGL